MRRIAAPTVQHAHIVGPHIGVRVLHTRLAHAADQLLDGLILARAQPVGQGFGRGLDVARTVQKQRRCHKCDPRADHQGFVKAMQREWNKPDYDDLALITTVFGQQDPRVAYAQTLAIVQAYPKLRGIIAPDMAAMTGAAKAVADLGKSQTIKLTGVGLPSRLASLVREGEVPAFVTWSPIDVGYAAARIALSVIRNEEAIVGDAPLKVGRLGEVVVDKAGMASVASLITVDKANIDKYDDAF